MSRHVDRAIRKARDLDAWAGTSWGAEFFSYSKRELIEAALHLSALAAGNCDDVEAGAVRLREEMEALQANGLI